MKTMILTDEQFEFLQSLSEQVKLENETLTKDHITADPIFTIREYKYNYDSNPLHYSESGYVDQDGAFYTEEEAIEWLKETLDEDEVADIDFSDNLKVEDVLKERNFKAYSREKTEERTGTFFLTNKAANRHLKSNDYHYSEGFVFVESAWRNLEIQQLRKLLAELKFETEANNAEIAYRAKLKSREQMIKDIPPERWGWWKDVCPGKELILRKATQFDLDRCIRNEGSSENPDDYFCELPANGALVSKEAIEYVMVKP